MKEDKEKIGTENEWKNSIRKQKKKEMKRKKDLTRGTVKLTSPQQIFLRPQPSFCERFQSMITSINDRYFVYFKFLFWCCSWRVSGGHMTVSSLCICVWFIWTWV